MTTEHALCSLDDIRDGGTLGVWPDHRGQALVLAVRRGGMVHAYLNICPHYQTSRLGWKTNEYLNGDGSRIVCAAHGALFRIEDGVCEIGPCQGAALTGLAVRVVDRMVLAKVEDLPARESRPRRTA